MNNDILKCVYCNERDNETDDHVPPKSFYPKPRPSNLITVPSCLLCNQGMGKDEEFFLATFMFGHAGVSDAGRILWAQKLRRTYEKNIGLKRKIAENLSYSDITTPAGIFLGRGMTINIDEKRFENVVNKILRGLYYFEYKEVLSNNTIIRTLFLNDEDRFNAAKANIKELKTGSKSWEGIFEYKFNRLANSSACSIWLFLFWGYACFWSVTYDEEIQNKINKKSQQGNTADRYAPGDFRVMPKMINRVGYVTVVKDTIINGVNRKCCSIY